MKLGRFIQETSQAINIQYKQTCKIENKNSLGWNVNEFKENPMEPVRIFRRFLHILRFYD